MRLVDVCIVIDFPRRGYGRRVYVSLARNLEETIMFRKLCLGLFVLMIVLIYCANAFPYPAPKSDPAYVSGDQFYDDDIGAVLTVVGIDKESSESAGQTIYNCEYKFEYPPGNYEFSNLCDCCKSSCIVYFSRTHGQIKVGRR